MDHTGSVKFFNRGPSPVVRLLFFSLLSLLLLFIDARHQYLGSARSVLSTLIYPLQRLTALPSTVWHEASGFLTTQTRLTLDNEQLRTQHEVDAAQALRLQGLMAENTQLRSMLGMRERLDLPMQLAEVLYSERDPSRHKLFVSLGAQANVRPGQAVLDDIGVVGQVTRVHPLLSEVTLITDKDHEVPVQVARNGLRVILFGSGNPNELDLRYAPVTADIQDGDVLLTSSVEGTYPPGLPVAKIIHVERDPVYPFARVQCAPLTGVNSQRWLFVLSSMEKLPPRPEDPAAAPAPAKARKNPKVTQ